MTFPLSSLNPLILALFSIIDSPKKLLVPCHFISAGSRSDNEIFEFYVLPKSNEASNAKQSIHMRWISTLQMRQSLIMSILGLLELVLAVTGAKVMVKKSLLYTQMQTLI